MNKSLPALPGGFRRLVWSNLAAQSAEQIALAAAPIIAVLAFGAGPGETGFLTAVQTLPFLLLSIPFGLLVDRVSRRSVMAAAEAIRAVALIAVPVLAITGTLSISSLALLGFVAAAGTVAFTVAAPAVIPALVPRGELVRANGQMEIVRSIAFMAGPALAGVLVGWTGASITYILAAALSAAAVMLLGGLSEPSRPPANAKHILRDLKGGASFVWTHALLRPLMLTAVAWNIAFFALQAIYVPYAINDLGMTATEVGITLAIYGAGLVIGSLLAARTIRLLPFGLSLLVGPFGSVIAAAVMIASAWTRSPLLAGVSFFLFGAGPPVWVVASTTLRQAVTPDGMLGRIAAAFLTVNAGSRPIGAALGGLVGSHYGAAACIWAIGVGFLVQAIIVAISPIPALRTLPAGPVSSRAGSG